MPLPGASRNCQGVGVTADDILFTRDLSIAGQRASAYSRVRTRALVKLHPGVYTTAERWDAADVDERYRMLVLAFEQRAPGRVFSHESAAALWRLPSPPPWPDKVGREALRRELRAFPLRQGTAAALRVIEFADGRADRPGESLSRVTMHRAGIPKPQLQTRLAGVSGRQYPVDFWWPEFDTIGEFDGRYKYSDPRFLGGRTPEQALYDEKLREDDLRGLHRGFARWNFAIAASVSRLRDRLAAAGVR